MPSLSSCPACHRDLTIPDLDERQQSLRCPLCDAVFSAQQALAECVPFPPLAIVVDADGSAIGSQLGGVDEAPRFSMGEATSGASGPTSTTEEPRSESRQAFAATTKAADTAPSDEDDRIGDAQSDADYAAFDHQVAAMRVAPRVRRQPSALGVLGQLAGMALGGVLGLAIGYYVLVWMGGAKADFLDLRQKVPKWLVPPVRRHRVTDRLAPLAVGDPTNAPVAAPPVNDPLAGLALQHGEPVATDDVVEPMPTDDIAAPSVVAAADLEPPPAASESAEQAIADQFGAGPSPLPEGYLGPRGFKLRAPTELRTALEQAEMALRCPRCQQPGAVRLVSFDTEASGEDAARLQPCESCRGKPVLNLNAAGYEQLCDLAEAVTFVQFDDDAADREPLRDAAEAILLALGGQRDKRELIGRMAEGRLNDSGRQTNGIALAGTVQAAQAEGEFFTLRILLLGGGKPITVVSRQPPQPPLAKRDHVIVLGSIVDSPVENLVGYSGSAAQVVWGGLPLKLAQ